MKSRDITQFAFLELTGCSVKNELKGRMVITRKTRDYCLLFKMFHGQRRKTLTRNKKKRKAYTRHHLLFEVAVYKTRHGL